MTLSAHHAFMALLVAVAMVGCRGKAITLRTPLARRSQH